VQNQSLRQMVTNIQGRAFYQSGNQWVDSNIQKMKKLTQKRIRFNSTEFFKLLKDSPELGRILALGKNVRFVHQNMDYEIYE
jgi:hypothetical protein